MAKAKKVERSKDEIVAKLGELGIDHNPEAEQADLEALLPEDAFAEAPKGGKKGDSEAKVAFQKVIDTYREQNPKKFALKKESLEKKLASL